MILIKKRDYGLIAEAILEKISDYQIYRYYIGRDFTVNAAFSSPLRRDKHPSFVIKFKNGTYMHMDLGKGSNIRGNCFQFVMQKYNCTYNEALIQIDKDFNLGLHNKKVDDLKQPSFLEPIHEKHERIIQIIPKAFTKKDLDFWGAYYQGIPELKAENVFSIDKAFLDKQRIAIDSPLAFGYLYDNKYWKIYCPLVKGVGKWLSTVPLQLMDGIEDIKNTRNTIVAKSKKDKMVLKYFCPTCSTQNESIHSFSEDSVTWLKSETRGNIYTAFDCDDPGVEASWEVTKAFGFRHVNVPYEYLSEGIKDFSDLSKYYGLKAVQEHLKRKEII